VPPQSTSVSKPSFLPFSHWLPHLASSPSTMHVLKSARVHGVVGVVPLPVSSH